jgi:hypothetical protein
MFATQVLLAINWADLGVIGVIALVAFLIIRNLRQDKKAGRCPGCSGCPHAKACPHANEIEQKTCPRQ